MAYKVLYRKYRPKDFNELYGQDTIKKLLIESIKSEKISHAYLFSGPRGTGKTSTAKLFAKTINCENSQNGIPCNKCNSCLHYEENTDIIEIDAASNNGVDEIRELRENAKILPTISKYKIYIIDEVHMLSQSAWNAFLKILEEPPSHIIFILATTEIQKIPVTILSRCQRYTFNKINNDTITKNLELISKNENINITPEALKYIAFLADGAMRDALSILDQLSKENIKIDIELIQKTYGLIKDEEINAIFDNLSIGEINNFIKLITEYENKGIDINILISKIINYLLELEIKTLNNTANILEINQIKLLSKELVEIYNKKNGYNLLKIILLSYFSENTTKIISREIILEQKSQENQEIISREIISDNKKTNDNQINDKKIENKDQKIDIKNPNTNEIISREIISKDKNILEELINIKINNSYVNASKDLKNQFKEKWQKFIDNITLNNNMDILSIIEDTNIEVVSPTNIIFTNPSISTSLLFNENLELIEQEFLKIIGNRLSFICLDKNRWQKEKDIFIKNKNKKYEYIPENKIKNKDKAVYNIAKELFNEEIIEIC